MIICFMRGAYAWHYTLESMPNFRKYVSPEQYEFSQPHTDKEQNMLSCFALNIVGTFDWIVNVGCSSRSAKWLYDFIFYTVPGVMFNFIKNKVIAWKLWIPLKKWVWNAIKDCAQHCLFVFLLGLLGRYMLEYW